MDVRRQIRSNNGDARKPLRVHLTPVQHTEIMLRSKAAGVSMSRFIVDTVMNSPGLENRMETADKLLDMLGRYHAELNKIGSNINQIARHANTTQQQPANTQAALDDLHRIRGEIACAIAEVWTR